MAKFIKPTIIEVICTRCKTIINKPVNIDLCKSLEKSTALWNLNSKGFPSIEFIGCNKKWIFNNESERDKEFERIILFSQINTDIINLKLSPDDILIVSYNERIPDDNLIDIGDYVKRILKKIGYNNNVMIFDNDPKFNVIKKGADNANI